MYEILRRGVSFCNLFWFGGGVRHPPTSFPQSGDSSHTHTTRDAVDNTARLTPCPPSRRFSSIANGPAAETYATTQRRLRERCRNLFLIRTPKKKRKKRPTMSAAASRRGALSLFHSLSLSLSLSLADTCAPASTTSRDSSNS